MIPNIPYILLTVVSKFSVLFHDTHYESFPSKNKKSTEVTKPRPLPKRDGLGMLMQIYSFSELIDVVMSLLGLSSLISFYIEIPLFLYMKDYFTLI